MRRAAAALLLALMLASCGTSTDTSPFAIVNRADGVLIVWEKSWYKDRFRLPMDHGASATLQAQVFQAFDYPADGGEPLAIAVSFTSDESKDGGDGDYPAVSLRDGALDVRACAEPGRVMGATGFLCSNRLAYFVGQIARRSEDVLMDGNVLVLAVGPGGEADCRVDLSALLEGVPNRLLQTPFRLAHFPGRGSYLAKVVGEALPVYRLQCGQAPQLLGDFAMHDPDGWTELQDIAPGADPAQPRVLLRTSARFDQAIVATPAGELFAAPADPVRSDDWAFLTADAGEIIISADYIFLEQAPRLMLGLVNIESGAKRTLDFRHEFAAWPKKP